MTILAVAHFSRQQGVTCTAHSWGCKVVTQTQARPPAVTELQTEDKG